jgi:hypothetical protein
VLDASVLLVRVLAGGLVGGIRGDRCRDVLGDQPVDPVGVELLLVGRDASVAGRVELVPVGAGKVPTVFASR